MIPIGDDNWDRRRRPILTGTFLAINVVVFLYQIHLITVTPEALEVFIRRWGVVPFQITEGVDLPPTTPLPLWVTVFTSMFLHGGWAHLGFNMLYLWIFGDNVEDRLGRIPFLLFYLGTGAVAALTQVLVNPASTIPIIGASGAISGILGAYLVFFPFKRVRVLFFVFVGEVPAIVIIGLWALSQLIIGIGTLPVYTQEDVGGVAYMAHVGGFLAGALAALAVRPFVGRRRPPRRQVYVRLPD
jgi:membrane associated rhomboid family serine protease